MSPLSARQRLIGLVAALLVSGGTGCYQDKPPAVKARASKAQDAAAIGLQPLPASNDSAIREIDSFQLTPGGFQSWLAATHNMDVVTHADPAVQTRMKGTTPPTSITEMAARLDAEPAMKKALTDAGMTSRNFMLTSIVVQQSMKGFRMKSVGNLDSTKVPPVLMANINFVGGHLSEILGTMTGPRMPRVAPRPPG